MSYFERARETAEQHMDGLAKLGDPLARSGKADDVHLAQLVRKGALVIKEARDEMLIRDHDYDRKFG